MPSHPPAIDRSRHGHSPLRWALFALPLLAVALTIAVNVATESTETAGGDGPAAPSFELPTLTGGSIALDDVLAEGDALLFFSMGVGCDGCFLQIPEIEDALAVRGIELLPIKVNPPDALAWEVERFGIDRAVLVDADRSVSEAYGMLGQFGHGDVPSHSFAHVASDGTIEHTLHYASMFVPLEDVLADLDLA